MLSDGPLQLASAPGRVDGYVGTFLDRLQPFGLTSQSDAGCPQPVGLPLEPAGIGKDHLRGPGACQALQVADGRDNPETGTEAQLDPGGLERGAGPRVD